MDLSAACGLVCHLLRLQYRGGNLTLCCLSESMGQLLFGRFEIGVEYVDSEEEALAACTPLSHTPPEGDPLRGWNLAVFGETEIQGDVGIVYLRGAIYGPPEIDYFQKLVDPMETPKMLIQCENLCAITADGVGVFVKLLKTYQSRQGLVLYRLNGLPHYFFATTGLDKIFPMADSIEDALAAFR